MRIEEIIIKGNNLNKKYKITFRGTSLGIWEYKEALILGSFDFYNDRGMPLTGNFFISNFFEMYFEEVEVIDWSKISVDTKVLVSDDGEVWFNRYFAKYENGKFYAWSSGKSSFTIANKENYSNWKYYKLYSEGDR